MLKFVPMKLVAGAILFATALQAHPKIASDLESLAPSANVDVIVQYKMPRLRLFLEDCP